MTASYLRSRAASPADTEGGGAGADPMRGFGSSFGFVEDGTTAKPGRDDADGKKRGVRLGWNDRLHGVARRLLAPVDGTAPPDTAPSFSAQPPAITAAVAPLKPLAVILHPTCLYREDAQVELTGDTGTTHVTWSFEHRENAQVELTNDSGPTHLTTSLP
jgi:hypothetical protein